MITDESEFGRLTRQIAELDLREAGLADVPDVRSEMELIEVRERRDGLKAELEELWVRRSNACCGDE
jgi:hypothetical protein